MTLLYNVFMHRITAAAGPGCIQAGPGFVVLLFFFMARFKAFKALGACHPCNYTLNTFKRLLKASRSLLAAVIELYHKTAARIQITNECCSTCDGSGAFVLSFFQLCIRAVYHMGRKKSKQS